MSLCCCGCSPARGTCVCTALSSIVGNLHVGGNEDGQLCHSPSSHVSTLQLGHPQHPRCRCLLTAVLAQAESWSPQGTWDTLPRLLASALLWPTSSWWQRLLERTQVCCTSCGHNCSCVAVAREELFPPHCFLLHRHLGMFCLRTWLGSGQCNRARALKGTFISSHLLER